MKFSLFENVGFNYRSGEFTLGTHDRAGNAIKASAEHDPNKMRAAADDFLRRLAPGGGATTADREAFMAAIVEPIDAVVAYLEMYQIFFTPAPIGDNEDPKIPVENIIALAWETHQDAAVLYVRPGYSWTRPEFKTFDTGIEINWETMRRSGWNVLARTMKRAAEALARKRDERRRGILNAAVLGSHDWTVSGTLTKASVDDILQAQVAAGFPITQVLVNAATIMDMGAWTWTTAQLILPEAETREVLRTLHFANYGGASWYSNVNAPANEVWFSGPASVIGYEMTRGQANSASDVDITQKVDRHAMYDKEYANYVQNALPIARLRIA